MPDLSRPSISTRDVVFTWNGTTSGVRVPNGDAIPADRAGPDDLRRHLAAFAQDLDWDKLDVVTFSWQKVMGGEAAHGMLILSPRAVERLESYTPAWPLPKIFRMTKGGKLIEGIFVGETINTPSMLASRIISTRSPGRSHRRLEGPDRAGRRQCRGALRLRARRDWIDNLAAGPATRSNTSVCLKIHDPGDHRAGRCAGGLRQGDGQAARQGRRGADIGAYRDAPPGLRIWCGATVETSDLEALMPWLDWAFETEKPRSRQAA
jgi:phosphoserine aminotransferase